MKIRRNNSKTFIHTIPTTSLLIIFLSQNQQQQLNDVEPNGKTSLVCWESSILLARWEGERIWRIQGIVICTKAKGIRQV